jgi:hypothetical protein
MTHPVTHTGLVQLTITHGAYGVAEGWYLQVDPLLQHPLLIELAEEARIGHTEGIPCHSAPAAGHTTEDVVVQLTQDA